MWPVLTTLLVLGQVGGKAPASELGYQDNDQVTLTLVDIDDAGLRSEASEPFTFMATDTLPPPQAGTLGVRLLREE